MAFFATPPPDVTAPRQQLDPYRDPFNPNVNAPVPLPPVYNFRDERYMHDTTPIPAPPAGPIPPRNLAGLLPLQVGAVSGGVPRAYASPDLAGILNRIFGQG
jgi:hypothetical protein